MLRRLWYPKENDILLSRLAIMLVLPAASLPFLLLEFVVPDSLTLGLGLGVFSMVLLARGVILIRGAHTLPIGEEDIDKYKATSEHSRQTFRVAGFILPLASTVILLFEPELFLLGFATSSTLSIVFLSLSLIQTGAFILAAVVLSAISFTVVAMQDGIGKALVVLIVGGVIVPQFFSTLVKMRRTAEKVMNQRQ